MSHPATPDSSTKAASVTPGSDAGATRMTSGRFDPTVLDFIVGLLEPDTTDTDVLRAAIDAVFSEKWRAKTWFDLSVFTSDDIAAAFSARDDLPEEITAPVLVKKLGYIVTYACMDGVLTDTTTMRDIVRSVTTANRAAQPASSNSTNSSPTRRNVQIFDTKKAVPTLDKFTGHDEDYFTWKESTVNAIGTAGFSLFLEGAAVVVKHPDVARSIFYSLRGAVHGGQAQSIAQKMLDDKQLDPFALWMALEMYYDTPLNRANVVLFDIHRLLNLRLDPDTAAMSFISDYRNVLIRLRKNNARLADDNDTLRALLLVAIQDDDFDLVRDAIIRKPESDVEDILTDIREREASLVIKDHATNVTGDGVSGTRISRRAKLNSTPNKKAPSKQFAGGAAGRGASNVSDKKWWIPRFPDSWKKALGKAMFKMLLDWRTEAHKGKPQAQLTSEFEIVTERVVPKYGQTESGSTCQTGTPNGSDQPSAPSETNSRGGGNAPPRKRVRLQKSRRVLTESYE